MFVLSKNEVNSFVKQGSEEYLMQLSHHGNDWFEMSVLHQTRITTPLGLREEQ
jgi:hypothetical protein